MEHQDAESSRQPTASSGHQGWGIFLIILGWSAGVFWTFAIWLGESLLQGTGGPRAEHTYYFGTILTALASIGLIIAGLLLLKASSAAAAVAAGKNLATAAMWLTIAAAAAYLFGFVVCWTGY